MGMFLHRLLNPSLQIVMHPKVTAGGLIGASMGRKYLRYMDRPNSSSSSSSSPSSPSIEETLAYAGAAGTLTGFMNVPLAGPIFALEMTNRRAGISPNAARSWSAAVASSLAGMALVRGMLTPNANVGGHFLYVPRAGVGTLTGADAILAGSACGIGGAMLGTAFHATVRFLKSLLWPAMRKSTTTAETSTNSNNDVDDNGGGGRMMVATTIGRKVVVALTIGLISTFYPQTMFWGEGSLQGMIDGQMTPFSSTPHGIPTMMTRLARVDPNRPFSPDGLDAMRVGAAKFAAIALASAVGYPGGVIFPLLSNGATLSHAFASALRPWMPPLSSTTASSSLVVPLMTMGFMAATLTSITRTPLATVLILALTASGTTPLSALLPGVLLASYVSIFVSDRLSSDSFFSYSK
jgi:H+/Cl- antiporter ClcA